MIAVFHLSARPMFMQGDAGFIHQLQAGQPAARLVTQAAPGLHAAKKPAGRPGCLGTLLQT